MASGTNYNHNFYKTAKFNSLINEPVAQPGVRGEPAPGQAIRAHD